MRFSAPLLVLFAVASQVRSGPSPTRNEYGDRRISPRARLEDGSAQMKHWPTNPKAATDSCLMALRLVPAMQQLLVAARQSSDPLRDGGRDST